MLLHVTSTPFPLTALKSTDRYLALDAAYGGLELQGFLLTETDTFRREDLTQVYNSDLLGAARETAVIILPYRAQLVLMPAALTCWIPDQLSSG